MNPAEVRASIASCRDCRLSATAIPVPYTGTSDHAIVGEAPGQQENRQGQPFVGPAGRLLRKTLGPGDYSYLNTVNCWPHQADSRPRTPTVGELRACRKHLDNQLRVLAPRYLLLLGRVAVEALWPGMKVSEARGNWWVDPQTGAYTTASWHPSAVLREGERSGIGDEFREDVRGYVEGITDGPWPNWWCVTCQTYTEIRLQPGSVTTGVTVGGTRLGVPYCAKHYTARKGLAGQGRMKQETLL